MGDTANPNLTVPGSEEVPWRAPVRVFLQLVLELLERYGHEASVSLPQGAQLDPPFPILIVDDVLWERLVPQGRGGLADIEGHCGLNLPALAITKQTFLSRQKHRCASSRIYLFGPNI